MGFRSFGKLLFVGVFLSLNPVFAGTEGVLHISVQDADQVSIGGAKVKVLTSSGAVVKQGQTSATGEFTVSPIDFGDYTVEVDAPNYNSYRAGISVASGSVAEFAARLTRGEEKEMVKKVQAKRRKKVQDGTSSSSVQITKEDVEGASTGRTDFPLPKLITLMMPWVVRKCSASMFFRGNHANIQYQILTVFFSYPVSLEYFWWTCSRLAISIIWRSSPQESLPSLASGSPWLLYHFQDGTGDSRWFSRGQLRIVQYVFADCSVWRIDGAMAISITIFRLTSIERIAVNPQLPNPTSATDVTSGGPDIVHDYAWGNNEFGKVDWIFDNSNKFSFIAFNNFKDLQIPTFPSSFGPTSAIFTSSDSYGNNPYVYFPPTLGDSQNQEDTYVEAVWKHTFSEHAFLQVAPYYKYSQVNVIGDPTNDLYGADPTHVATQPNVIYDTFSENRTVNNFGLKSDFTLRPNDWNLIKRGSSCSHPWHRAASRSKHRPVGRRVPLRRSRIRLRTMAISRVFTPRTIITIRKTMARPQCGAPLRRDSV